MAMRRVEREAIEVGHAIAPRSFAHFDPDTGVIAQVSYADIPPTIPNTVVAVFRNVHWSQAMTRRVDLRTVHRVDGDYVHCDLTSGS